MLVWLSARCRELAVVLGAAYVKDMDFINLKHMSATDIALCFGVPSQLVGVPDAQTYANVT